jgi:hypothetical protein
MFADGEIFLMFKMEMGSDQICLRLKKRDEIEEQLGRDKFIADISVADGELKM